MMSVGEERVLGWEAQGFDVLGPELLDTTLR